MSEMPSNMPTGQEQAEESAEQIIENLTTELKILVKLKLKREERDTSEPRADDVIVEDGIVEAKTKRSILERLKSLPLRKIISANPELVEKVEALIVGGEGLPEKSLLVVKNFPDIAFLLDSIATSGGGGRDLHFGKFSDTQGPGLSHNLNLPDSETKSLYLKFNVPCFCDNSNCKSNLFGERTSRDDGAWDDRTWLEKKQAIFKKTLQEACQSNGIKNLVVSFPHDWLDGIEGVKIFALGGMPDGNSHVKEYEKRWGVEPDTWGAVYTNKSINKAQAELRENELFIYGR